MAADSGFPWDGFGSFIFRMLRHAGHLVSLLESSILNPTRRSPVLEPRPYTDFDPDSDASIEAMAHVKSLLGFIGEDPEREGLLDTPKRVVKAMNELDVKVPVVVRLAGTNVEEGQRILADSDVDLITADTLAEAGERAVAAVSWEAN